jgi:segregation and condensation protein B
MARHPAVADRREMLTMAMRLVRDEPDVQLDDVRGEGVQGDATVFTDLAFTREPSTPKPAGPAAPKAARKARKPMSSKSQVIEVPDFPQPDDAESASAGAPSPGEPAPTGEASASTQPAGDIDPNAELSPPAPREHRPETPIDEMSDGVVPPQELPHADEDPEDSGSPDADVPLATLEALLLTTHHPLTPVRLNELLSVGSTKAIHRAIRNLNDAYEQSGRCFRIEQVAGGYQMLTLPEHADALKRLHQKEADAKLTKAALETLAIIAYKQPILRADVEAIRGVACGEAIRGLMEKHLVKIAGRAEEPGRPILYGTTKRFLELFGLNSLKDLPKPEEFKPLSAE